MEKQLHHNLIDWLNDRGEYALEALAHKDIRVSTDSRYPGLYNLKYGSILADKTDPIVCACRGAVVEKVDNDGDHSPYFRLVAYALDRFFNLGEGGAAEIDWDTATVFEKYDGSLIKLFNWNGNWIVSTSGSVGAASAVGDSGKSFEELFWEVFDHVGYSRDWLDPNLSYVFELCHELNRIVVDYKEPKLPLLAVRDRSNDFAELPLEAFCAENGFNPAEVYPFGAAELVDAVNARGADHEGFIVCDSNGNRIKVKSDMYVQLHRVRGNGTPDFSELYLNGDLDEFFTHFPEYRAKFAPLLRKIDEFAKTVEVTVDELGFLSQKDFAIFVNKNIVRELTGAMFSVRAKKSRDFHHYVENLNSKQLDRLLGI